MNKSNLTKKVEKNLGKFIKSKDDLVFCKLTFLNPKTMKMENLFFDGEKFKEE